MKHIHWNDFYVFLTIYKKNNKTNNLKPMAKFLKKFTTHTAYESYISGLTEEEVILPNVSYCVDANDVHYNPEKGIIYEASAKLSETTSAYSNGLHTNAFNTTITSHTFKNGIGKIEFAEDVTSIGDRAFYGCTGLTSITIPKTITSIGRYILNGCSNLTNIVVAKGNTTYDSRDNSNAIIKTSNNALIQGCNNSTIPNTITSIGNYAFSGCSGLTSITIPSSVTSIGSGAFMYCSNIASVTIPNSVITIGDYAFQYCSGLTNVIIGNGVTTIDSYAFMNCSNIASVTIGSSVNSIGSRAFYENAKLATITSLATTAPTIQNNTFENVKTGGTLYVPTGSDYSTWMANSNYYLGKQSWHKVEQ